MDLFSKLDPKSQLHVPLKIIGLIFIYLLLWTLIVFKQGPAQKALHWLIEPCTSKATTEVEKRSCPHPLLQIIFNFW